MSAQSGIDSVMTGKMVTYSVFRRAREEFFIHQWVTSILSFVDEIRNDISEVNHICGGGIYLFSDDPPIIIGLIKSMTESDLFQIVPA